MDKNKYLTCSKNMSEEYCCTIVRLGEILEIPGAKTIAKTIVNGRTIIVSKNQKEGDIMFYVSNESQINADFLSVNNQFHDIERNANCDEIEQYLVEHPELSDEEKKEYLKYKRGYFNEHGRVKMTRMFNEVSMGYLFPLEFIIKWCPKMLFGFVLADMVGYQFDTVNGENFVKPYVPYKRVKEFKGNKSTSTKLAQYDRLVPGQFEFNYSTNLFELNMHRFYPETPVVISNKIHGCVERNTLVETKEFGKITIGEIVDNQIECKIKAFDVELNEDVFVPIDDYYLLKNDGEWYEIELEDGRKITITGNNPVWVPEINGYRRVDELNGDEYLQISE